MTVASTPLPAPTGAVHLTDWGLIRAQGADALVFLQGQLTQDVTGLPDDRARLAGYCSAKGRLSASFVVWRADRETVYLACSADLLAATLKRLSMFVLRAKCKLSDASADFALHGLVGADAAAALGTAAPGAAWTIGAVGADRVIRLPDAGPEGAAPLPRFLLVRPVVRPTAQPIASPTVPADAAVAADAPDSGNAAPGFAGLQDLPALAAADWAWLEVRSGVARIVAATVDHFVPQMVNFELVGGVNFQKGCYPGQEVVARSQYRGTLKRRALVFDCAAALAPGQEVVHSLDPDQPAGEVVLAAARPDGGWTALVEVKLAALDSGSLHAGTVDGALLVRSALPYTIPADAG